MSDSALRRAEPVPTLESPPVPPVRAGSDRPNPLPRTGVEERFTVRRLRYSHFVMIAGLHVACLWAPATFSWSALGVALFLYWAVCGLGISMGYHRLLTHRGFRTSRAFRFLLACLGAANLQGGPLSWVGIHRVHHRDSDEEGDPHSPRHGFLWAHLLWCLVEDPLGRDCTLAAGDLKRERAMRILERLHWLPLFVLGVVLYALGGWSWVVWGVAVRTVFTYHTTWLVNSASHTWGYKNFETHDDSRNNWWVALISWGEGWHNNHHAHPRSARHGLRPTEIDATYWTLRLLEVLGVVSDIRVAPVPTGPRR